LSRLTQDAQTLMKTVCDLIANTLNLGKRLCCDSDDALQSPLLHRNVFASELDIKASMHDGVETCLQCTSVLACDLPLQGNIAVLNPEKGSCCASDDALQPHLSHRNVLALELEIKANIHDGVEPCLQCHSVLACNLPLQGNIAVLNPGKGSCCASDDALQSPLSHRNVLALELDIKANIHDGVETCLQHTSVSACDSPLQGNIAVLNPGKGSCCASDDALQSPLSHRNVLTSELDIKANINDGVETCLQHTSVSACNLPPQDNNNIRNDGALEPHNLKQCITCSRYLANENFLIRQWN
jgi:predicted aconitase with swiveling domain